MFRVVEYFAKSLKVIRNDTLSRACVSLYQYFCRAMLCKRGLCRHAVSVCVCVCPSVCHVTFVDSVLHVH